MKIIYSLGSDTENEPVLSNFDSPSAENGEEKEEYAAVKPVELTRKQKKKVDKKWKGDKKNQPLKLIRLLNMTESEIYQSLRPFVHHRDVLSAHGYPIESHNKSGQAFIRVRRVLNSSQTPMPTSRSSPNLTENSSVLNPHAQEFTPRVSNAAHDRDASTVGPPSSPSNLRPTADEFVPKYKSYQKLTEDGIVEFDPDVKDCLRCFKVFKVNSVGDYMTLEECRYHWGKVKSNQYSCCFKPKDARGCHVANLHVWKGVPTVWPNKLLYLDDYVITKASNKKPPRVYALDAEMAFTAFGLEPIRVTVVGFDGRRVYEASINPPHEIIDFNSRFSGITERSHQRRENKSLKQVQNDLMGFLHKETILVGHGLENDLRVMKIVHENVIDTAIVFMKGQYRNSLKTLAKAILSKHIQSGGHDSLEDAATSMELMLWKIWNKEQNPCQIKHSQGSQYVYRNPEL